MADEEIIDLQQQEFERFEHNGVDTIGRKDLKGEAPYFNMCSYCKHHDIEDQSQCPMAEEIENYTVNYGIVVVVWQCPHFGERE